MSTPRLMMQALACQPTARRPLWIMRQAGRYLPEYRELKSRYRFEELCADPALAAEVTLMPLRRFALDAAIVFADLLSPVAALGVEFRFDPGPVIGRPVRSRAALEALARPRPEEVAPEVAATLRRVRAELDPAVALLGFGGAPLSLAAYLVEGRGVTGFPTLRALLRAEPALFGAILERLAELVAGYLVEQHRAGADAVQVFDSWAGILSREDWQRHVRPHLLALLEALGAAGVPRILFANGAPHLAEDYAALPSEGLALCWRSELAALRERIGYAKALQGNLDPALLLAGPEVVARETRAFLARMPARGHIVNLGHGITPEAPLESVAALIEAVHAEGEQSGR